MSSDSVVYHKLSKRYAYKKGAKKEPPGAAWRQAYRHPRRLAPIQFVCGVGRHVALRGSVHRRRSVAPPFTAPTKAPTGSVADATEPVALCMFMAHTVRAKSAGPRCWSSCCNTSSGRVFTIIESAVRSRCRGCLLWVFALEPFVPYLAGY